MRKTNGIPVALVLIAVTVFLSGCQFMYKEGTVGRTGIEVPYHIGIVEIPFFRNNWDGKFVYRDHEVEVLDKDPQGRVLYKYRAIATSNTHPYILETLVVCQKNNENYVWFYDDVCYLSRWESMPNFSDAQIEELKSLNDWGQALNLDACQKVAIKSKSDEYKSTHGWLWEYDYECIASYISQKENIDLSNKKLFCELADLRLGSYGERLYVVRITGGADKYLVGSYIVIYKPGEVIYCEPYGEELNIGQHIHDLKDAYIK